MLELLLAEQTLDEKYRDHGLSGNYVGFRECHILPDWLLIYEKDEEQLILTRGGESRHRKSQNLQEADCQIRYVEQKGVY